MTRLACWCVTVCFAAIAALGCGEEDPAPGACGGSPFVGRHLWQVGNCEAGTVVPVSAASCGATLCGGNAREVSECNGETLFELTADGTLLTLGDAQEPMELTRAVDCPRDFPQDVQGCREVTCMFDHDPDFYMARYVNRPVGEQLTPDGMWFVMDDAWPGRDQCNARLEMETRFQQLADACPF